MCLIDRHRYLACDGFFKRHKQNKHRLMETILRRKKVELSDLWRRSLLKINLPVPDWWAGWKPSSLLLVPLLSFFANYYGLFLQSSDAAKVHLQRRQITELLVFVLLYFVESAAEDVFISIFAHPGVDVKGLRELGPMAYRVACSITDLGFFQIMYQTGSEHERAYVALLHCKNWSWLALTLKTHFSVSLVPRGVSQAGK